MPEEPTDKSPAKPGEEASAKPGEEASAKSEETTGEEARVEAEEPAETTATKPSGGRRVAQIAGVAALTVALVAAGFFVGRGTKDSPAAETTTVASGGGPTYDPRKSKASYDGNDVVKVFPPIIVRDGEILAEKKGSPGRALLEWWQAYQFDDVQAVLSLTSKSTIDAIGEDKLIALVELPGPGLQGLEVLNASESGDTASVNAGLLNFQPETPGGPVPTEPTNSVPETFAMQKEGGDWRFAATDYLSLKLNTLPE